MSGVFRWKTCSKEGTLVILYGLSANALTEKVSESTRKVQNVRQTFRSQRREYDIKISV